MEKYIANEKPTVCIKCGEKRDNFPLAGNGHGKWYYRPTCTTCKGRQDSARYKRYREKMKQEDPEGWKLKRRREQLKRYYGMTLEEYQDKLKQQGGGCAICGRMEGLRDMPVDHCHKQGHIRGILCHWCNKGLGQFFDNPENLRKAANYIDSWVK